MARSPSGHWIFPIATSFVQLATVKETGKVLASLELDLATATEIGEKVNNHPSQELLPVQPEPNDSIPIENKPEVQHENYNVISDETPQKSIWKRLFGIKPGVSKGGKKGGNFTN